MPFSPSVAGRLNPDTIENPTHRPTTTPTNSMEARPVDPVEPTFTGENGERSARTKQGNGDKGGFSTGPTKPTPVWVCWISYPADVPDPNHRAARTPSSLGTSPLSPAVHLSQAPITSRPWKLCPWKLPPGFSVEVESYVSNFFSK
jgi:hypothetical protein